MDDDMEELATKNHSEATHLAGHLAAKAIGFPHQIAAEIPRSAADSGDPSVTHSEPHPCDLSGLAWDEACLRLEDYLRAHAVAPRERLLALTLQILQEAKALPQRDTTPLECTMALAIKKTDEWFAMLAGDPSKTTRALSAYFSSVRSDLFLVPSPSEDFVFAIRSTGREAAPALEFQSILRKAVDYGTMEDIARETWEQFSWRHVLRAFVLWLAVFLAAWVSYLRFFR